MTALHIATQEGAYRFIALALEVFPDRAADWSLRPDLAGSLVGILIFIEIQDFIRVCLGLGRRRRVGIHDAVCDVLVESG